MLKNDSTIGSDSAPIETGPNPSSSGAMFRLAPGIAAGTALGISDVLTKIVLATGADVLTSLSCRSGLGLAFVATWLRIGPKAHADARVRWISMGIGLMFTGLIFCLFKSIEAIDVPTAILSYFTYPLLTGLTASLIGFEPLRWRGVLCAIAAFFGLAIMIGAHPAGLAFAGVAYALGAALCRTGVLLATRAYLVGADARLTTWYSMISSTAAFVAVSLATQTWNPPQTSLGWMVLVGMSLSSTAGVLFIFISTMRVGPFRTALITNLEPLTVTILSALILGQVITPVQGVGCAVMLASLVAFQLWR
jgi:drug/metabolite transporter (DMT)-like permease